MTKELFEDIVYTGVGGRFLFIMIGSPDAVAPYTVLIPRELLKIKVKKYLDSTDEHMIFKNTGDRIINAVFINNVQELSWLIK